jgi:hypothetical protein
MPEEIMNKNMACTPCSNAKIQPAFINHFPWILAAVLLSGQLLFGIPPASASAQGWREGADTNILPATPAICPSSMNFGETIQCSIDSTGEEDSYTFTGTAGDQVWVEMSRSSGSVWPNVGVNNPDGTYLCGAVKITDHSSAGVGCTLPSTGTYTIQAADYDRMGTGDYYLFLQRLNNPVNAVSIPYGQTHPGTIATPAQNDTYTFTGSEGDQVYVRMSKSSGSLWSFIVIYNPDGTYLCGAYNAYHGSAGTDCALPSTGTYSVLAADIVGTGTGDYYLYVQRLNNPGNAAPIPFGQTLSGTITMPAQNSTYTFAGSTGDKVYLRMRRSTGSIWSDTRVYDPDGTYLCGGYNASTHDSIDASCALPSTGSYTILVADHDGTATGDYYLFVQRLNNPGNALPIAFGKVMTGTILTPAQMDAYTFPASAGDKVAVNMVQATTTYFGPEIMLFDPYGTQICNSGLDNCTITSAGTHTILAAETNGKDTGGYYLNIQRLNNPVNAVPIAFGQTLSGSIALPTQSDPYTLAANAGDKVLFRMSASSGNLNPGIYLYGSDGSHLTYLLCTRIYTHFPETIICSLTDTGIYSIFLGDYYGSKTGEYYFYIQRLNNPGNAVSIAFGQTLSGALLFAGEIDAYTFTANAGDIVLVRMTRSPGTIWPEIKVYGPDGTELCATWGYSTAEISSCNLPSTGTYTVLADDDFQEYTGDYSLYLQRLNNPGSSFSIHLPLILK